VAENRPVRDRAAAVSGVLLVERPSAISLLDESPTGLVALDEHWRYAYVNDAAARQAGQGQEALLGRVIWEVFPEIDVTLRRGLHRAMRTREVVELCVQDAATRAWLEVRAYPIDGGIGVATSDVSVRKRLEEQSRQARKREAVAKLAGGVAHELNDLLSVVISHAELLADAPTVDEPLRRDLREIALGGQRAAELTAQLLAFSRQQVLRPEVVDLNDVLTRMEIPLRRLLGDRVALRMTLQASLWTVYADPALLAQVIKSLVANSVDAMALGGELHLETSHVELDEDFAQDHPGAKPGPHVMLAVRDTGIGMSEEVLGHLFEPFFTTKRSGRGAGLGLASALGIVQQSGGAIDVESAPGKGATFRVFLPRSGLGVAAVSNTLPPTATLLGTETLLVVVDDAQVRAVVVGILESNGYDVLVASTAAEALERLEAHPSKVHALLADVVAPRLDGKHFAVRLAELRPALRVLYLSGHGHVLEADLGERDRGRAFLQKPVTPFRLLTAVRDLLG
jgi:two-component system, cell cycle sensor histidine kinase and response regulator CckA